jgi:hypothetical protein
MTTALLHNKIDDDVCHPRIVAVLVDQHFFVFDVASARKPSGRE